MLMTAIFTKPWVCFNRLCVFLAPLGDLVIRLWVAHIFYFSALTKIKSWQSTEFLFKHEYHVPLLSPKLAAFLGTGVELIAPVLLVLGLFGRFPALLLFVFNIVAVISYPYLWTPTGAAGLEDHLYWGLLLMMLLLHGPGRLSIDCILKRCCKRWHEKR